MCLPWLAVVHSDTVSLTAMQRGHNAAGFTEGGPTGVDRTKAAPEQHGILSSVILTHGQWCSSAPTEKLTDRPTVRSLLPPKVIEPLRTPL